MRREGCDRLEIIIPNWHFFCCTGKRLLRVGGCVGSQGFRRGGNCHRAVRQHRLPWVLQAPVASVLREVASKHSK